jgi:serine/threonine protein kinase
MNSRLPHRPQGHSRLAGLTGHTRVYSEARLRQQIATNPAWRVLTIDGLNWIDPFTGTLVPAPFGLDEPALAWLLQQRPWVHGQRSVDPKALADLQAIRWIHWLKTHLPDPEYSWLRQFMPDGSWLNPFTADLVGGIGRENGRMTMDTVRQLATVLRDCPAAQSCVPLAKELLAQRIRERSPAAKRVAPAAPAAANSPPAKSATPEMPVTTARVRPSGRAASIREARPTAVSRTATGSSTGALERSTTQPPSTRTRRNANRPPSEKPPKPKQPITEPSVRVVSGYRILGTLGMGGMSTVYRAVQLSMEREVALKVLDQQGPPDPGYTERFLREARAAGRINHPNVVTCYDVGVHHGSRLYMALELVTGGDATALADQHGGRIPERLALGILRDAARGLGAIQAAGLIHRDIKPANLFIAADGSAKLGDLGLVRDITPDADTKYRTLVGIAVGTPAFMSPEQSQGAKDLDIRSDIYALGASVFALLAGRPPHVADTIFDLVGMILKDPVPAIRDLRPEVGPLTATILTKAMAKDRAQRYQTPFDLLLAAEDALAHFLINENTAKISNKTPLSTPIQIPDPRITSLPTGSDKLRAAGIALAEVRGNGLTLTLALNTCVLCVAAVSGTVPLPEAHARLDARLRAFIAVLRTRPSSGTVPGQPEATPASLCRALLVDGLIAAVALIDLIPRTFTVACTPQARAALIHPRDAQVLTDISITPTPTPFASHSQIALAAGISGRPLQLWSTLIAHGDQGVEATAAHLPLSTTGTILLLSALPPADT